MMPYRLQNNITVVSIDFRVVQVMTYVHACGDRL